MAAINNNQIQPVGLVHRILKNTDLETRDKQIELLVEFSLSSLACNHTSSHIPVLNNFVITSFDQTSRTALSKLGIYKENEEQISFSDKIFFHLLLQIGIRGIGFLGGMNTDFTMALLSSPAIIRRISRLPWFQSAKTDFTKELSNIIFIKSPKGIIKEKIQEYKEAFENTLKSEKSELIEKLNEAVVNFLDEKTEAMKSIVEKSTDFVERARNSWNSQFFNELSLHDVEKGLTEFEEFQENLESLTELPKFELPNQKIKVKEGKINRILSAYYLLPQLAPLLLTNPEDDFTKILARIAGTAYANHYEQYFFALVLTECICKFSKHIPKNEKMQKFDQIMNRSLQDGAKKLGEKSEALKKDFEEALLSKGMDPETVKKIQRSIPQLVTAFTVFLLNPNAHPMSAAINFPSTLSYVGTLINSAIPIDASSYESDKGYLWNLPYWTLMGLAFSFGEVMTPPNHAKTVRPLLTLLATLGTMPVVSESITNSKMYWKLNYELLKVLPGGELLKYLAVFKNAGNTTSNLLSYLVPSNYSFINDYLDKSIRGVLGTAIAVEATRRGALRGALRHILDPKTAMKNIQDFLGKKTICDVAFKLLGPVPGSMTLAIGEPLQASSLPPLIIATITAAGTNSPLASTITFYVAKKLQNSQKVQEAITQGPKKSIEYVVSQFDPEVTQSMLGGTIVGAIIMNLTGNETAGVASGELARRALLDPKISKTARQIAQISAYYFLEYLLQVSEDLKEALG
ncbi:MAG: hypothetical protein Tsb0021_09340 [Chlamydiales bacterium]